MAATPGSVYQAILLQHIANNPPNAFPQTSQETFGQYQIRMASQGLPPDIGSDESDSAYLARLATYLPVPPVVAESASFAINAGTSAIGVVGNQLPFSASGHSFSLSSPFTGSHYFLTTTNQLFIYNGTAWKSSSLL